MNVKLKIKMKKNGNGMLKLPIAVMLVILYLTLFFCWAVIPEYTLFNASYTFVLLLLTLAFFYYRRKDLLLYLKSDVFRFQSTSFLSAILYFFVFCMVNYFAYRFNTSFDLTKDKVNTLSKESIALIKSIDGEIKASIFARSSDASQIYPLLQLYRNYKQDWAIEVIDPDLHRDLVQQYQISQYGTVVLEWKQKKVLVPKIHEVAISQALLNLKREKTPKLYFTTGHGEANLVDETVEGYSYLKSLIDSYHYQSQQISLLSQGEQLFSTNTGDTGANILVILGPKTSFAPTEIKEVGRFLKNGGKAFIILNPDINNQESDQQQPLNEIIKDFGGVTMPNSVAVDKGSFVGGSEGTVPSIHEKSQYDAQHPITERFEGETFFPLSRAIKIHNDSNNPNPSYAVNTLVITTEDPESWAKMKMSSLLNSDWSFKESDGDMRGPIPLVVAVKETIKKERSVQKLVFWGTVQGLKNHFKQIGPNFILFLNSLSWLTDEEFSITADRMSIKSNSLYINSYQMAVIFYFSMIIGPLLLLAMGVIFFYRRKKS